MNAVDEEGIDEVVISTLPRATSGWLRRNVPERVRGAVSVPVRHVVVEPTEAEAAPAA
jgi:hypothetical protein